VNAEEATRLATIALACLEREFPFQPGHVMAHAADFARPRVLHPAFHGCYDWHSAVHAHWLLVRVLRRFPESEKAREIHAALDRTLTAENLAAESQYLEAHPGFERPYGWAWVLKLAYELTRCTEPRARAWRAAIAPLTLSVERLYLGWLPRQTYPIRSGVHSNTAFALALALDYARSGGRVELEATVMQHARGYFAADKDCPASWEPSGNDFLSPCLVEAELMRRVLPDFAAWLAQFLPTSPRTLLEPVAVSDRADGQLAHLDGLNLSRAWCLYGIGLREAAERHLEAGLAHVASGHFEGEHWLASFAALALEARQGDS
jgi:hypothetical protein